MTIYKNFQIFNGWVLLTPDDEATRAIRIDDITHMTFSANEPRRFNYMRRGVAYEAWVQFDTDRFTDDDDPQFPYHVGAPKCWALFDAITRHGEERNATSANT